MDPYKKPDQIFKILLFGGSHVGKSSFFTRCTKDEFTEMYTPTPGLDFQQKLIDFNGQNLKLLIWDTLGSEEYLEIISQYLVGAHGVFILYDLTDRQSFIDCVKWIKVVENHSNNNIVKMLVANKSDEENGRKVSIEEGQEFANNKDILFIETSAKSGSNIEQAVQDMIYAILVKLGKLQDQAAP